MPASDSERAQRSPLGRGPIFWVTWDFLVPLAIALGLSLWLASGDRELNWERSFAGTENDWPLGDKPFWQFIYHATPTAVKIIAVGALLGLLAGIRFARLRPWRRVFWYPILILATSSGIITTLILKEYVGRPRPRELIEFGGRRTFESLFHIDFAGPGKSFPSGHATTAFFFFAAYFLLRRYRFGLSLLVLAGVLALGGLVGYCRMIQGGHFATDIVWAGAITFFTAAGLYHALELNRRLLRDPKPAGRLSRIPLKVRVAGGLGIAILIGGLAFATPYRAKRNFTILHPDTASMPLKPSIKIPLGDVEIVPGETLTVTGQAWGHGLPTSEIASRWIEEIDGEVLRPKLYQYINGYLTEIRQNLKITIPWERTPSIKFALGPGQVRLQLPEPRDAKRIELQIEDTNLLIEMDPEVSLDFSASKLDPGPIHGEWEESGDGPRYVLRFTKRSGGSITIRERSPE